MKTAEAQDIGVDSSSSVVVGIAEEKEIMTGLVVSGARTVRFQKMAP